MRSLLSLPRKCLLCVLEPETGAGQVVRLAGFGLTPAEQEVAEAMARGAAISAIAEHRGVSVATVRSQVQAVYTKCGVRNRAEFTALALGFE